MEQINNKFEEDEIKWGGILNEFLWTCAGVNKKILRQCPTDYAKYAGIGGTILFTALMAMLSGGYALNFVFDNQSLAICFGVFWGLLIFNLDRFIVNTMYSDGKVTISWGDGLYKHYGNGYIDSSSAQIPEIKTSKPLESTDKIVLYRYLSRTRSKYCRHREPKKSRYKVRCAKWTICPKVTYLGHERLGTKFDEKPFYINIGDYLYNKGIKIAYEDGGKSIARRIIDYFYDNFCEVIPDSGTSSVLFRVFSGSRHIEHP